MCFMESEGDRERNIDNRKGKPHKKKFHFFSGPATKRGLKAAKKNFVLTFFFILFPIVNKAYLIFRVP